MRPIGSRCAPRSRPPDEQFGSVDAVVNAVTAADRRAAVPSVAATLADADLDGVPWLDRRGR